MSDQPNCPITWSQLVPPPPDIVEYHLAISRSSDCPLEDHQLHVFRFTGKTQKTGTLRFTCRC